LRIPKEFPRPAIQSRDRILWQNRSDSARLPGGDTTVIREMVTSLQALGSKVDFSIEDSPNLSNYRLVHLNNISRTRDTLAHVKNAKLQNRPTVLTSLYEDMDRYLVPATKWDLLYQLLVSKKMHFNLEDRESMLSSFDLPSHPLDNRIAKGMGIGDFTSQLEILKSVDYVLTSGAAESKSITEKFGPVPRMESVHFGFNKKFLDADGSVFSCKYGLKDFVLCVGRLEARKNQWSLIEIFRQLPKINLVLIGFFSIPDFEKEVKAYAPPNVHFFERLPFDELVSAFGAARVHVLPSWYELPGLVSLEAAAAGCQIVSTSWGTAKDYFQERAFYCEPNDPEGIRNAILEAYDSNRNRDLRDFVEEHYGWEKSAIRIQEIYAQVLG
jgi:glycosyltransferase involved in cell wall biosynthesis